jgi:hypothetical protein
VVPSLWEKFWCFGAPGGGDVKLDDVEQLIATMTRLQKTITICVNVPVVEI